MQLAELKAIVTGGASGLGHAVARHFVAHGGKVALFDVNEEKGQAAAKELGDAAHFYTTDVTSEDGVAANVATARDTMGGVNVVMNCAGIIGAGRVLGKQGPMPLGTFAGTVMVNLVGSFNVAKAGAALMQHNDPGEDGERGVIINTASVAAYEGQIGQAAYSASKGGVVGMTLPMARELSRFGIRVMTIAPGIFWTPMVEDMPPQVKESLSASIPFPSRLGTPEEFAETVAFILANRY
ncbi:MAG: SDR family NAD(P)-dependent oxidoreductase, partial [Rhodanobacteraceae bacterium]